MGETPKDAYSNANPRSIVSTLTIGRSRSDDNLDPLEEGLHLNSAAGGHWPQHNHDVRWRLSSSLTDIPERRVDMLGKTSPKIAQRRYPCTWSILRPTASCSGLRQGEPELCARRNIQ